MVDIREFTEADTEQVLSCIVALQEHERMVEPLHRPGYEMAEEYLAFLQMQCLSCEGKIFVAVLNEALVGFSSVWIEEQFEEILTEPMRAGYISDLVVLKKFRGAGIGPALMGKAEAFLIEQGVGLVKVGSLSRNPAAANLYRKLGYRNYSVTHLKSLSKSRAEE